MTAITGEDLKKYGMAVCLLKMAMTPEEFEEWYAGELARREEKERTNRYAGRE